MRVRLMGGFELRTGDGTLLALESSRAEALLGYLLLHRSTAHPRGQLAFLLWPDTTESQARTNLRHLLHTIRRTLPDAERFVEITPRTLRWHVETPCWIDVAEFEHLLDRAGDLSGATRLAALTNAVDAYTGDLLAGHYQDWLLTERDRIRARYLQALDEVSVMLHERGDHAAAATYAERLIREDPLREATYRLLMHTYEARGDRARAVRTYHVCASTLERELDVGPSAETRATYESLLRGGTARPHRDTPDRGGDPRLVGRVAERATMTAAWRATEEGPARLIVVTGDPGIGKTRLTEEFAAWCANRGAAIATARVHAAEGAPAYDPIVQWLRSPGIRPGLDRLTVGHQQELVRLLPELLAEIPGLGIPAPLPASEQRQRLFDAVTHALFAVGRPVLLVADDLHRFDQETLHLVHYLLRGDRAARLLMVATARPEDAEREPVLQALLAGLRVLDRHTELELSPLSAAESADLAVRVAGVALTDEELQRLYRDSEGNPLFLIEALRAGRTAKNGVSPKVQAVIESRLARLSDKTRDLLGVAATIGREFGVEVLTVASGLDEDTVVDGLDELWLRRIVREQGTIAYDFTHEKIREVAYHGLSPARRRNNHLRIAQALERAETHRNDELSGQLARHYERAGATERAVHWYSRAADAAVRLHANSEAIALLDHAMDLLATLGGSTDRVATELDLLTMLQGPIGALEGYSSPRLFATQSRALELTHELDVDPEPPLVRSLALTSVVRSDFEGAQWFGRQLAERGARTDDDVLVVESAYILGIAAFWQARFEEARNHFDLAIRRYRPDHRGLHLLRYSQDPQVVCTSRLANTLWFLGQGHSATAARDAALVVAEEVGHPYSRAVALIFAAVLAVDMADEAALRKYSAELDAMELESPQNTIAATAFRGYLDVLDGETETGIARIREAIEAIRAGQPAPGARAMTERLLMAAYQAAGDGKAALATAERVLEASGGHVWQTAVARVRQAFLAQSG